MKKALNKLSKEKSKEEADDLFRCGIQVLELNRFGVAYSFFKLAMKHNQPFAKMYLDNIRSSLNSNLNKLNKLKNRRIRENIRR